jgi:hypothetical protein
MNGIKDVDHGLVSAENRLSENRRVQLINEAIQNYKANGFEVTTY